MLIQEFLFPKISINSILEIFNRENGFMSINFTDSERLRWVFGHLLIDEQEDAPELAVFADELLKKLKPFYLEEPLEDVIDRAMRDE